MIRRSAPYFRRFWTSYLAVALPYERFTKRVNVFHIKNGHIILFAVSMGVSWLLYLAISLLALRLCGTVRRDVYTRMGERTRHPKDHR